LGDKYSAGGACHSTNSDSKLGVARLTKVLANERAKYGVNAIAPDYMAINNTAQSGRNPQPPDFGENSRRTLGEPEDLAGALVFLSSAASDYLQGHILVVDGGWMAR
jgi:2-deoxy-D-gluconate 3-dehydrogenase